MTKLIFCLKQNIINVFFVYPVILMILHRHQTTSHNGIVSYVKVSLIITIITKYLTSFSRNVNKYHVGATLNNISSRVAFI